MIKHSTIQFKTLLCLLLAGYLSAPFAFGQNLIQNGGFENGLNNWNLINGSVGAAVTLDQSVVYQGNSSVKLIINDPANMIVAGLIQTPNVLPNTTYLLSYAVKTNAVDFIAYPYLKFNNGTDYYITSGYASGRTQDWTNYTLRITTPAQVNNLEFYFFLFGHAGTAWVDAIQLTKVSPSNALNFNVNTASEHGVFKPKLLSTNSSPKRPGAPNDLTSGFQEIGIDEVRTHDIYNACDIHNIFPDMNADPLNPDAYHFEASDLAVKSIVDCGSTPFFRLGESFSLTPDFNKPPADVEKWATVCLQIVKHYNEGWNNGFNFGIEKWEIWNEPDLYEFWAGTPLQFYTLYHTTATKLKNHDPALKVGMAGFAVTSSMQFIEPVLALITANGTPLDFVSYHGYSNSNPYFFKLREQSMRAVLANVGLSNIETYLTEWNNYSYSSENTLADYGRDDALSAALTASTLYYLQESSLNAAHRYRSDEYYFGLFRDDANYSYSGMAFRAMGNFREHPQMLETSGGDTLGAVCMAGKSLDNQDFRVVVSNPNHTSNAYTLNLQNLPSSYQYQITRIDQNHTYEVVETGTVSPSDTFLMVNAIPPFVDLISFKNTVETSEAIALDLSIAPNPTDGVFQISSGNTPMVSVEISNAQGQLVHKSLTMNTLAYNLDLSEAARGIYFLKVLTAGNGVVLKKIVVK